MSLITALLLFTYLCVKCMSYIQVIQRMSWEDAENNCLTKYNSHLATMESYSDALECLTTCYGSVGSTGNYDDNCWIGLNEFDGEGLWTWIDGSQSTYRYWSPGEPDGTNPCINQWNSGQPDTHKGKWNEFTCTHQMYSVCNDIDTACKHYTDIKHLNLSSLIESSSNYPSVELNEFVVDSQTLSLNIQVDLPYLGTTSYEYNDNQYEFGTTFVLDFKPFDNNNDQIYLPGNCQNRLMSSFYSNNTLKNLSSWWMYTENPYLQQELLSDNFLAYQPGDYWDVSLLSWPNCSSIRYSGDFSWDELSKCTNYDASDGNYVQIETDEQYINLTGTFYVNLVLPFWYNSVDGGYRVFPLLSQSFTISIEKTLYLLSSVGLNLFSLNILSIYENINEDFTSNVTVTVLTESVHYLLLTDLSIISYPNNINGDVNYDPDALTATNCLIQDTHNLCVQKWLITINNIACSNDIIDLSGEYNLQFTAQCNPSNINDTDCNNYINTYTSDVTLSLNLHFSLNNGCQDIIREQLQVTAVISFFSDIDYVNNVEDNNYLFVPGTDTVYTQITLDASFGQILNVSLINVWICTFDPAQEPIIQPINNGDGGCLSNQNGIEDYIHIYVNEGAEEYESMVLINEGNDQIRFRFIVPNEITRDTLYVHVQLELFMAGYSRRRSLLTNVKPETDIDSYEFEHVGGNIHLSNNTSKDETDELHGVPETLTNIIFIAISMVYY